MCYTWSNTTSQYGYGVLAIGDSIGAINGNKGSTAQLNDLISQVVATTNTNVALWNVANSTQDFVAVANLTTFLGKERYRQSLTTFQFIRDPPYLKEILSKPYLKKYESPTFLQYDGREGNVVEHVSESLDAMRDHVSNKDLCQHEFSKSFFDRVCTWHTTLLPNSVCSWDEMVEQFCQNIF